MKKFASTREQIQHGIHSMYLKMTNSEERKKAKLKVQHKKHVERNTSKYGLNG